MNATNFPFFYTHGDDFLHFEQERSALALAVMRILPSLVEGISAETVSIILFKVVQLSFSLVRALSRVPNQPLVGVPSDNAAATGSLRSHRS